jgi:uncharacterized membrane protein
MSNFPAETAQTTKSRLSSIPLPAVVAAVILIAWLINTPPGILGKADALGYAVCHRIDERSFHIGDRQVALCARCTGMYLGAMLGLAFQFFLGKRRSAWPSIPIMIVLGIFVLAFGIDGGNSAARLYLGRDLLYSPHNTLRMITGTGMGLFLAVVLLPTFHQTVWTRYSRKAYFLSWKPFALLLGLAAVMVALVLTEQTWILWPLSLISATGVLVMLTLLYSMILLIIFKRENKIENYSQLAPWLLFGFIAGLIQVSAFDIGRYLLTGTWEGIHLLIG